MTTSTRYILGSGTKYTQPRLSEQQQKQVVKVELSQFPNKETRIRILEDLSGTNVYILTPLLTNTQIVELALLTDAARRSGAKTITAVTPWLGYSPQDKVFRPGEPLSSQVVIRMLESAKIDRFVTADLHSTLLKDMFSKPPVSISAHDVFVRAWKHLFTSPLQWVVVSLDNGSLARSEQLATSLHMQLVKFKKERDRNTGAINMTNSEQDALRGKHVLAFDDFTNTGGTLIKASGLIKEAGAKTFHCFVTHIVTRQALKKIRISSIDSLTTTNSTFLHSHATKRSKIHVVDIWAEMLKHAMR